MTMTGSTGSSSASESGGDTTSDTGTHALDEFALMLPHWVYVLPNNLKASQHISQQDVPLRLVKA